jgi:anti-anti-sigma regulatory factor
MGVSFGSGVLDPDLLEDVTIVHFDGVLRAPIDGELSGRVQELLAHGKRNIVVDLAVVSDLDAAGVGELVRAHNLAVAADAALRITHPDGRIRELLARLDLLTVLNVQ